MTDELNKKVIDLFSANKKTKLRNNSEVCKNEAGYFYISIDADENGRHLDEEILLQRASEFHYIVKVMVKKSTKTCINNFKIPGDELLNFIKMHTDGKAEGQIIEIDKFFPEEWA